MVDTEVAPESPPKPKRSKGKRGKRKDRICVLAPGYFVGVLGVL
jgi:hypothetical protein